MANSVTIKSLNIKTIYEVLKENESMSKTDIAKYTGLSFPTVSTIIEHLIEKEEVIEVGLKSSLGGRCAKKYSLNPMYAVSLLLYLEGNKINWILNDFCRNKIDSETVVLKNSIVEQIDGIVSLTKSKYSQLASIVIGIASNVAKGKVESYLEYEELKEVDIIKYFTEKYNIPVEVENDMNVAINGYWERHNNKDKDVIVNIYMGDNGVGAGMIFGGKVWKGATSFAGELHYLPIDDNNLSYCKKGFHGIDIVEYYGKIIQSYIALVNPNLIVIYNNSFISDKLEEIIDYCKLRVPQEVMPELILSDEFVIDYEYGLGKIAIDLIDSKN